MSDNDDTLILQDIYKAQKKLNPTKSNIIKAIEEEPKDKPKNCYKEYHDDYSRHRDVSSHDDVVQDIENSEKNKPLEP